MLNRSADWNEDRYSADRTCPDAGCANLLHTLVRRSSLIINSTETMFIEGLPGTASVIELVEASANCPSLYHPDTSPDNS